MKKIKIDFLKKLKNNLLIKKSIYLYIEKKLFKKNFKILKKFILI